jgi:predicted permease
MANLRETSPGYFGALGIALKSGRLFREGDEIENPAVVSESVARRLWPGEDPVGREINSGIRNPVYATVVGVVTDVPVGSLESESAMAVYRPYWNRARTDISLVLRTTTDPQALASAVRKAIWEVDRDIPVPEMVTMEQLLANSVAPRRLDTLLLSAFAAVSLLLACLGVYGVVAYSVLRRTNEIGVRMALGAHASQVRWLILRDGMLPVTAGLLVGLAAAAGLSRLLQSMLFEVEPLDLPAFLLGPGILLAASLAACLIPARRAARVDPLTALRYE